MVGVRSTPLEPGIPEPEGDLTGCALDPMGTEVVAASAEAGKAGCEASSLSWPSTVSMRANAARDRVCSDLWRAKLVGL